VYRVSATLDPMFWEGDLDKKCSMAMNSYLTNFPNEADLNLIQWGPIQEDIGCLRR